MNCDNIVNKLMNMKYRDEKYDCSFSVISKQHEDLVRVVIADALNQELSEKDSKISELEAKVYAYEQIIANSNFAPVIKKTEMTVEEYREKLIDTLHRTGHDEFISVVVFPEESEFQTLEYVLQAQNDTSEHEEI